jgi:hypothetical protein
MEKEDDLQKQRINMTPALVGSAFFLDQHHGGRLG